METEIKLTDEHLSTVTDYADGSSRVMGELGIDRIALEALLLDHNIERCPNCGWYDESFSMIDDGEDGPDGFCDNCRKYDKPESST